MQAATSEATSGSSGASEVVSGFSRTFLVYIVAFHLLWIVWPFVLYPRLQRVGDATLTYAVLNLSFRFLFWILPVLGYLRYVDG